MLTQWLQYLAARVAVTAMTSLDVESSLRAAAAVGRAWFDIDQRHRQRALHHLGIAFGDLDDQRRLFIGRRSFEHFTQLAVEICYAPRLLNADSWPGRVRMVNVAKTIELFCSGQPAIMVTGHLGNWEVLGYQLAVFGVPISAIARPLDNPLISDWLYGLRQRNGLRIITKWGATQRMLNVLSDGGTLGFIADQNAGDKGLFVPFFGHLASSHKSIGLLAMQAKLPIICGAAHRRGPFKFEMGVSDIIFPEDWQAHDDPLFYVTARYMRAIEKMIRAQPEQYLWMHRRWKSRPRHERLGKPMPAGLRKNLESLDWMDQPALDRLAQPMPAAPP